METLANTSGNPQLLSPLALAFVGDAVYELLVRERLVAGGNLPANKLHQLAVRRVCAGAQSQGYQRLEPLLSEEELAVLKRGRNAHSSKVPKHADVVEYRRATGLECLFGYLYLLGRIDRVRELFALLWQAQEEN